MKYEMIRHFSFFNRHRILSKFKRLFSVFHVIVQWEEYLCTFGKMGEDYRRWPKFRMSILVHHVNRFLSIWPVGGRRAFFKETNFLAVAFT